MDFRYAEGYGLEGLTVSVNKYAAEGYVPDGDVQEPEPSAMLGYKKRYMQRMVKNEVIKVDREWQFDILKADSYEQMVKLIDLFRKNGFVPQGGLAYEVVLDCGVYVERYRLLVVKGL